LRAFAFDLFEPRPPFRDTHPSGQLKWRRIKQRRLDGGEQARISLNGTMSSGRASASCFRNAPSLFVWGNDEKIDDRSETSGHQRGEEQPGLAGMKSVAPAGISSSQLVNVVTSGECDRHDESNGKPTRLPRITKSLKPFILPPGRAVLGTPII
jgi:hypothetical protein